MTKKSDRYRIREMELEFEQQNQRERLLAEAFLHPPGIYLLGLGGSGLLAFFSAAMTPPEKRTESDEEILHKGLIAAVSPLGGVYAFVGANIKKRLEADDANPLQSIVLMAGTGGIGLFTALLMLNEMKPEGGGDSGGVLATLLGAVA